MYSGSNYNTDLSNQPYYSLANDVLSAVRTP
jgi:hypothetical protein